jgi:hypothetical protein
MAIIGYRYYVTTGGTLIRHCRKNLISLIFSLETEFHQEIQLDDFTANSSTNSHTAWRFLQLRGHHHE